MRSLPSARAPSCAPVRLTKSTVPSPSAATPEPEALPLRIVYEDRDIVVLDKPAGMVVHPGAGHAGGTLVNALLHHVKDLSGVGGELRPGIVHRLDRGTSGLMVVAKHDTAHQELSRQFSDREVEKEYVALVWGVVHAGPPHRCSRSAVTRTTGRRCRRARAARRNAVTRVTFSRDLEGVSLLRVAIATGRTHQIRVHLSAIGHPIVGDATYGGVHRRTAAHLARRAAPRTPVSPFRPAGIYAPGDGRRVEFDSPLPLDLQSVLDEIEARKDEDAVDWTFWKLDLRRKLSPTGPPHVRYRTTPVTNAFTTARYSTSIATRYGCRTDEPWYG